MHPREEIMLHIFERVFKILSAVVDWIDFISIFLSTHVLIELSLGLRGVACAFTRGGWAGLKVVPRLGYIRRVKNYEVKSVPFFSLGYIISTFTQGEAPLHIKRFCAGVETVDWFSLSYPASSDYIKRFIYIE